jgi:hypothetical protein
MIALRVFILDANPVARSFGAALHEQVLTTPPAPGHEINDCHLYAESFIMSEQERIDTAINKSRVSAYADRLPAAGETAREKPPPQAGPCCPISKADWCRANSFGLLANAAKVSINQEERTTSDARLLVPCALKDAVAPTSEKKVTETEEIKELGRWISRWPVWRGAARAAPSS